MKLLSIILLMLLAFSSQAVTLTVYNQSQQIQPNVVVWLQPKPPIIEPRQPETKFIMGQKDRQFTPHILVVEQNGLVDFPNADSIMHHVYSFSKSKSFELKLYREQPQDPIKFEQTGVVELGCNIHDWMLGYIVVVDSLYYGITDEQGQLTLDIPQGDYTLTAWHEGFSDISSTESQQIIVNSDTTRYQLKQVLIPRIAIGVDEYDDY